MPLILGLESVIHWSIEGIFTFIMGAPVEIGYIQALTLKGDGRWHVWASEVRISSTLPEDTLPASHLQEVVLYGRGLSIDSIWLRGGSLTLIRLKPLEKNYRFFPRRNSRPRPQHFLIRAESLVFHLSNLPPAVFVNLFISSLHGKIQVDSAMIRIAAGRAELQIQDICIREAKLPPSSAASLALTGEYDKRTDTWQRVDVAVSASEGILRFIGTISRWESLRGSLGGILSPLFLQILFPSSADWIETCPLAVSGEITHPSYELRVAGDWNQGFYDICLKGERTHLQHLNGAVTIKPVHGHISFRGPPSALQVKGQLQPQGLTFLFHGSLNLGTYTGILCVRDQSGSTLQIAGGAKEGRFYGQVKGIPFKGKWSQPSLLSLELDTVEVQALQSILLSYSPLWRGGNGNVSLRFSIAQLTSYEYGEVSQIEGVLRQGHLTASGHLRLKRFNTPIALRLYATSDFQRGKLALEADLGHAYISWKGNHAGISGVWRWEDVVGEVSGESNWQSRQLWLQRATVFFPTGEALHIQGRLSLDSADVQVEGDLPLAWILRYLPLPGLEVYAGSIEVGVCGQGSWDTLFHWENPTTGVVKVRGVKGSFPQLALPLTDLEIFIHYLPEATHLRSVKGQIGSLSFSAEGEIAGALSYLYTDWYRLRGWIAIRADHFILSEFWRRVERTQVRPQVRFPSQMSAQVKVHLRDADLLGFRIDSLHLAGRIEGLTGWVDTAALRYAGALAKGQAFLDLQDSTCYMIAGSAEVQQLPIHYFLKDFGLIALPTFQKARLKGAFSGHLQFNLRFTPEISWLRQSSLYGKGSIADGQMRTPRFMRWLRPYYLSAYRDSMDFIAHVPQLSVTDGFLKLSDALLISRVAALQVSGYHYIPAEKFLYRIQAVRVRRRIQRYPHLEVFTGIFSELLDRSMGLLYVEKDGSRVRWHYPWRYLIRRLFFSSSLQQKGGKRI
ncbi:MAG: AsmA family protein [Bacteroidia bacterium]|nr:AsmA family protein [Bacteroidia bacterium]